RGHPRPRNLSVRAVIAKARLWLCRSRPESCGLSDCGPMVIATIAWITSAHEGPQPRKPALSDRAKRGESDGSSRAQLGSAKSESRTIYAFALFQGTSSDPAESELGWRGASGLRFNSDRQWASVAEVFMERGRPRFRGFSKPGIP